MHITNRKYDKILRYYLFINHLFSNDLLYGFIIHLRKRKSFIMMLRAYFTPCSKL